MRPLFGCLNILKSSRIFVNKKKIKLKIRQVYNVEKIFVAHIHFTMKKKNKYLLKVFLNKKYKESEKKEEYKMNIKRKKKKPFDRGLP